MSNHDNSRRKFIKAAVYTAPVVMTLKAAPSFAKSGSHMGSICRDDDSKHCKDFGNPHHGDGEHIFNHAQKQGGFQKFIAAFLKIFGF